jgi:tRNA-specific 2-thiouridylase
MAKIVVGLSGGVDSAVAAYLLKKQGHEVIGAFMRNWDSLANNDILGNKNANDICTQELDYNDAVAVAEKLGIELKRVDFVKEYWDQVFQYFLVEHQRGRTPNPDVFCNKYIKFDHFLKFAQKLGADFVATGHYAQIQKVNGEFQLLKGLDNNKDQSYFLSLLNQKQLSKSLFPLGTMNKDEVRRIAKEQNLPVATKKDSTGICFIGERDFQKFLHNYLPMKKGKIVDKKTGDVVGEHNGVFYYTIGQRKGLGIGGISNHETGSWFVVGKDVKANILYVVQGDDAILYNDEVIVNEVNWVHRIRPTDWIECYAKFRYRQADNKVKIKFIDNDTILVKCDPKVKAITPGQIAVFYDGLVCLGGGVIDVVK